MPPTFKISSEKNIQAVLGYFLANHPSAETNDVGVVMKSTHLRTQRIMDQGSADLGMTVRSYTNTDTAAADQDAEGAAACCPGFRPRVALTS